MTTISRIFQDFDAAAPTAQPETHLTLEAIEDLKLQAFETGYQAGWEDSVKAQTETKTYVSSALATNLQSASFTYDELRSTLNASVQIIISKIVDTVLPKLAQASLAKHICDCVDQMSHAVLDRTIEITVAPPTKDAVQAVLSTELQHPFKLVTDTLIAPENAVLRLGDKEIEIDLDRATADITTAIQSYFAALNSEVTDDRSA